MTGPSGPMHGRDADPADARISNTTHGTGQFAIMEDETNMPKPRDAYLRVVDSALLIAVGLAILQFTGWTYQLAYLKRFSIDPSGLGSSNVAIGVEGVTAITSTFAAWANASIAIIVVAGVAWPSVRWFERRRGSKGSLADRTVIRILQAGGMALALVMLIGSGSIAGRKAAADRILNVRRGEVWTYHLKRETIAGVPVAQSQDTTWLLTKGGIRPVRTSEIRLIDGPLLKGLESSVAG